MIDPWRLIDPDLAEGGRYLRETSPYGEAMTLEKLLARRAWIAEMTQPPRDDVGFERVAIPLAGHPDVVAYLVNADRARVRPAILYLHGGGFTAASALSGMREVQGIAAALDCPILTVDYRIAPETRFDGSVEDSFAALCWLRDKAGVLGIDLARIAVLGDSAGGGHAVLLALAARDRGGPAIAFQALIYPMLDDRTGTSRALPQQFGYFGWNAEANRFGWECFLGRAPGGEDGPVAGVPARAADLSALPPTYIAVGALDLFADEDVAFATRLMRAGVPVELLVVPGAFHGFDAFAPDAPVSRRFTAAKLDALRRGLGISAA
jgi:acetyl esterase/lipase